MLNVATTPLKEKNTHFSLWSFLRALLKVMSHKMFYFVGQFLSHR